MVIFLHFDIVFIYYLYIVLKSSIFCCIRTNYSVTIVTFSKLFWFLVLFNGFWLTFTAIKKYNVSIQNIIFHISYFYTKCIAFNHCTFKINILYYLLRNILFRILERLCTQAWLIKQTVIKKIISIIKSLPKHSSLLFLQLLSPQLS